MMYELSLQGNKTLTITEEQKKKIEEAIEADSSNIFIGKNYIKANTIKGIFPIEKDTRMNGSNDKADKAMKEWNDLCEKMSKDTLEEKVDREINIRVLPLFINKQLSETTMAVLRQTIESFFRSHPIYPRCPSKIWWGIVKEYASTKGLKFIEYVIRNDDSVERWVQYVQR